MANCKDCVHVEVCGEYVEGLAAARGVRLSVKELDSVLECDDCKHFKDRSRFVELPDYKYSAEERFRGAVQELIDIAKASETPSKILQATSESLAHFACELSKLEETKQTLKERENNAN